MTTIPNCPQPETPIRERAWTDAQIEAMQRDAARYQWLRISACEVSWNEWCSYSPGYSADGPEELDAAIDAAMQGATP